MPDGTSIVRQRVSIAALLATGVLATLATGLVFEALTDRDWSITDWEWPEIVTTAVLVSLASFWLFSVLVERHRARASIDVATPVARGSSRTAAGDAEARLAISNILRVGVSGWAMPLGDRAALEGIVAALRPSLSIEIGTHRGGSLLPISRHSDRVHTFDLSARPEVVRRDFPNVTFHVGDTHELLAPVLAELAEHKQNVDFVLIDGDHSTVGAVQDIADVLSSPAVGRSIILVHDAINPRVRNALEQVDYESFAKVTLVDHDFVQGFAMCEGEKKDQMWNGLALIVVGWELPDEPVYARGYPAPRVWDAFSRSLGEDNSITAAQVAHVEEQFEREQNLVRLMEQSVSWRLTRPLRAAKSLVRRT